MNKLTFKMQLVKEQNGCHPKKEFEFLLQIIVIDLKNTIIDNPF